MVLRIPVDPEGMKGPGSPKCHGFLGCTRGLVFLEDQRDPEDPGGMSMKFKEFLIFKGKQIQ